MSNPSDNRPYLGDPPVIEKILISLVRESINCRVAAAKGFITDQDANTIEEKEIENRVRIFLNRDKGYAIDPEWNKLGVMDTFLARELTLQARGWENILKAALGKFLGEVRDKIDLAKNTDISEAQWKEKIQGIIPVYRDYFLGVSPKSQAAAPTAAPEISKPTVPAEKSETVIITKPFLSDPQVVEKILLAIAKETIKARIAAAKNQITEPDANAIVEKETLEGARIFLGRNKSYVIDADWHVPGVMDNFLAKELRLEAQSPEEIIKEALLKFVLQIWSVLKISDKTEITEAEWKPKIQNVVESYKNVFLGLPALPEVTAESKASEVIPDETPAPTLPDWMKPEPAASLPDWLAPEKKTIDEEEPEEIAAVATAAPASRSNRSGSWKWALIILLTVGLAAAFLMIPKRTVVVPPAPVVVKREIKKPEPKVYLLKNGSLVITDGKQASGTTIPFKGVNSSGVGGSGYAPEETQPVKFWYDLNTASGTARFLVASREDWNFVPDTGASAAHDLWVSDENGKEQFIHKSVLRAKFSPDGSKIAYTSSDCILHVVDLEGKELARTTRAYEPNWNQDGTAIVFEQVPPDVRVYPADALQLARFDWQANHVEIITNGRFDDVIPHFHPNGKWILFVGGVRTGGTSFWKVPTDGGQAVQLTNIRLGDAGETLVPTPSQTTVWSPNGRWFLFDFKMNSVEQVWGLEFDENGSFKRATKVSDGLSPQWTGASTFVCQKRVGEGFELVEQKLPES